MSDIDYDLPAWSPDCSLDAKLQAYAIMRLVESLDSIGETLCGMDDKLRRIDLGIDNLVTATEGH